MKRDILMYAALTAVAKGLQFLMLPLLTRLFSPQHYGMIELIATLTSLLTIVMSVSMESALARKWHESASATHRAQLLSSTLAFVATFGTLLLLALWAASAAIATRLAGMPDAAASIVTAVGAALALALSGLPQMALRMERKVFRFGVLQVLQSALGIVFSLLLMIKAGLGLYGLFLGTLLASLLVLALGLFWVREHLTGALSLTRLRECLDYGLPLTPAVFINWANGQADRIVLMSLLGLAVVGVYGAAAKVATIITVLVEVFRLAWLPAAMQHLDDDLTRDRFFGRGLTSYLAVMCTIGLVVVAFSQELLTALTTDDYAPGYVLIPWLIGAQILYGSGSITNAGMLASKKTAGNSIAATAGAAANIGLGVGLVAAFGMWGSAIGSFVAAFVFTALLLMLSARHLVVRFDRSVALGIILTFVIASAGVLWLYRSNGDSSMLARTVVLAAALFTIWAVSARSILSGGRHGVHVQRRDDAPGAQ